MPLMKTEKARESSLIALREQILKGPLYSVLALRQLHTSSLLLTLPTFHLFFLVNLVKMSKRSTLANANLNNLQKPRLPCFHTNQSLKKIR